MFSVMKESTIEDPAGVMANTPSILEEMAEKFPTFGKRKSSRLVYSTKKGFLDNHLKYILHKAAVYCQEQPSVYDN